MVKSDRSSLTDTKLGKNVFSLLDQYSGVCLSFRYLAFSYEGKKRASVRKEINPFQNKPWFLHVCCISHSKTLWEKEKLLTRSNFSFSHSVFYLPLSLNSKLSSAISFRLEESKFCRLDKG